MTDYDAVQHHAVWEGADPSKPAICLSRAVINGKEQGLTQSVYGLQDQAYNGSDGQIAAMTAVFSGDGESHCYVTSAAQQYYNDIEPVIDNCVQMAGFVERTVNGESRRMMVLTFTRFGRAPNSYAVQATDFLDLTSGVWVQGLHRRLRGNTTADWTRTIEASQ